MAISKIKCTEESVYKAVLTLGSKLTSMRFVKKFIYDKLVRTHSSLCSIERPLLHGTYFLDITERPLNETGGN